MYVMYMCEPRHGFCHFPGRGHVQLLILRLLHASPSHGYQIMEDLERITAGNYVPETGSIYTILRRMEKKGLVTSKWKDNESGADRRVYTLTKDGIKVLREGLKMVRQRRQLMDSLVQYYDKHFAEPKEGDE